MHPHLERAINEIDAAMMNGDVFEDPGERKEMIEYLKRWCKRLSEPYYGTEPPTFEKEWAAYESRGYQYGHDALENVKFGFRIAKDAYERGYVEEEQCGDCGEVINGAHGHCPAATTDGEDEG